MKKRKKKKRKLVMNIRAAIYCRVGRLEELSPTDMKEDSIIVQNNKKALLS